MGMSKYPMGQSWEEEARRGAEWHETRREKCAKIGSLGTSRAYSHSRMYHGILWVLERVKSLESENAELRKVNKDLKKQLVDKRR
jgi:hypothetical protein